MDIFIILLSLGLLMFLAYKGYSVLYIAPILAVIAAASSGFAPLPAYSELFMTKAAGFVKSFMAVFILGAVFGKLMEASGMAKSISIFVSSRLPKRFTVIGLVLTGAIMTYGGVNGMVAGFAVYPVAANLFKQLDWPKRFIPATIFLGFGTATMDALPGSLQPQNIIPTAYFGTNVYAAPVTGLIGAVLLFGLGIWMMDRRIQKAVAEGEGYGTGHTNESQLDENMKLPDWRLSLTPLLIILVLNYIFSMVLKWDPKVLEPFAAMKLPLMVASIQSVSAIWSLIIAELAAIIFILIVSVKNLKLNGGMSAALNAGAIGSLLAVFNVATEVGYGGVISSTPAFHKIANFLLDIKIGGSPLMSEAITVNLLSGITGSASGGMSIAFEMMGQSWLHWANSIGMSPELLHRIGAMASGGMDTLPHNGGIITLLAICGLTHKQSYGDLFRITILKTLVAFVMVAVVAVTGIV